MKNRLVSIIVPVFNTAEYIEPCIQSVLSQSCRDIELILVNDGSTDGSGEVCKRFAGLPDVQYAEQEKAGVVAARKRGVDLARGEWIAFVDSDDLLPPDGILDLLTCASDADIVLGRHDGNTSLLKAPAFYSWKDYLYGLYDTTIQGAPWAKLFRRELFLKCPQAFEHHLVRAEDVMMNLALAAVNRKDVPICKSPVYHYRKRPDSITATTPFSFDDGAALSALADTLVEGVLSPEEMKSGSLERRLYFYYKVLLENDFQGDKNHPFAKDLVKRLNEAKGLRLSDRLMLSVSGRPAVKTCFFFSRILKKFERLSVLR